LAGFFYLVLFFEDGRCHIKSTLMLENGHDDSDLDILIDPTPETTLLDIGAIRHE
jgi:hypothetical protein